MTEKRYFGKLYGEEYYIFDSMKISEEEIDKKIELEGYSAFAESIDDVLQVMNNQEMMITSQEKQSRKQHQVIKEQDRRILELENKLNQIALEFLNHEVISMGKAVEISEMSYIDFLRYRKDHGNPMELQL